MSLNVEIYKYGAATHCYSLIVAIGAFDLKEQEENTVNKEFFSNCACIIILFCYTSSPSSGHHFQSCSPIYVQYSVVHSITQCISKPMFPEYPTPIPKKPGGPVEMPGSVQSPDAPLAVPGPSKTKPRQQYL